jgi:4-hydroxymandelate oxidase
VNDTLPLTIPEFEELAAQTLDPGPLGYFQGGAADELTLRDNVAAWRRLQLLPRTMVDVSERDPSTTVLGVRRPHPLVAAPMAFQRVAHEEGEGGTARGCASTGTPFCLSTFATASPADLARAAPDSTRWFQLYVFRDRGVTRELVQSAADAGFEAVVLTVDLPLFGHRERDLRSGFTVDVTVPSLGARPAMSPEEIGAMIDQSLTWEDAARLADESSLPLVVKGVLTPEDARLALDSGARAVVVSNHGGRQLDTVPAGADALPRVVDEVGGEVDVLVDGGIRRGTDVVKALALGAQAVMVGRPVLWGLAAGGQEGVRRVLQILLAELDTALALAGAPRATELDESWLRRG